MDIPIKLSCSSCLVRVGGWNNNERDSKFCIKMSMASSEVFAVWKVSSNLFWAIDIFLLLTSSMGTAELSSSKFPRLSYAASLKKEKLSVSYTNTTQYRNICYLLIEVTFYNFFVHLFVMNCMGSSDILAPRNIRIIWRHNIPTDSNSMHEQLNTCSLYFQITSLTLLELPAT